MDPQDFQLAAGSIIGRDHRQVPRNSQDSYHVVRESGSVVAIVTDGCSGGRYSEVGAHLGARLTAESLRLQLKERPAPEIDFESVARDVTAGLRVLARQLGEDMSQVVADYFLFTVVGAVLTPSRAVFFAFGDGVVVVNGEKTIIDYDNQPPYIGYHLLDNRLIGIDPYQLRFVTVASLALGEVEHFLIGSDGVADLDAAAGINLPGLDKTAGPLSQFWEQDRYYRNPALITRQLNLIARDWPKRQPQPGLLPDDTTLIVGRRTPSSEEAA